MISRTELIQRFSSEEKAELSPEEMSIAVQSLKNKAEHKGLSFNCAVLAGKDRDLTELENFLTELNNNKAAYNGKRFQFVFNYKAISGSRGAPHWICGDVRVNEGNLEFYVVDAYDYPETYFAMLTSIQKVIPLAKINLSVLKIQRDSKSCGYFALDHAWQLAKTPNLYDLLSNTVTFPRQVYAEHLRGVIQDYV